MANKKRSDGDKEEKKKRSRKSSPKKKESSSKRPTRSQSRERSQTAASTSQEETHQESPSPKGTRRSSERLKEKRKSSSPRKRHSRKSSEDGSGNESAANASSDVPPGGDGQSSPESCPICLCRLQNKSFTDSCFHTFCFVCLQEWSKQKAECPLCKQKFKSIIHNVRSLDDYDQYYIQENNQLLQMQQERRFRYRTTMADHTYDPWLTRQQQERERQLSLLQRPSRVTARHHWRRLRQSSTSAFRKRVYTQNMKVNSVRTGSGRAPRYRNTNPEFYARNSATTHRLVPWLNRELNVILGGEEHREFILELIIDLIKRFDIQSAEFREHIHPFIGRYTDTFIHEFYSYARSPYDMVTYDDHAVYEEPTLTVGSDSDQEDVVVLTPPEPQRRPPAASLGAPSTELNLDLIGSTLDHMQSTAVRLDPLLNRVQEFLAAVDGGGTANSGWESPLPGTSSSVMWSPPQATTPPRTSGSSDPFSFLTAPRTHAASTASNDQPASNVNTFSSSGSESDIEIVGYEKPFEQRTPIAVNSSDSDIIDMDAEKSRRSKKKKKKKSKDDKRDKSSKKCKNDGNERRKNRSRSRSRSREKRRRSYERTLDKLDGIKLPRGGSEQRKRHRHEDWHKEKERRRDYLREHKKSSYLYREGSSSSRHSDKHRDSNERDFRSCHHDNSQRRPSSDRDSSNRHRRSKSRSTDGWERSRSYSLERSRPHSKSHKKRNRSRSRSRSNQRSQTGSSGMKSESPEVRPILKRRTPEKQREAESSDGSKESQRVTFGNLHWTTKSPSPRHRLQKLRSIPKSPPRIEKQAFLNVDKCDSSPENSCASVTSKSVDEGESQSPVPSEVNSVRTSEASSPEKSTRRIVRSVASVVHRKSRSRSSDSDSTRHRSVASVIRVRSRSRSRSSDCQFFISRSKYRARDSDDSSIEFIVAKPAKRHKKHKKSKKHKKHRYYVIEDTDSEGNPDIEILDVLPTKHRKKSKENTEAKKYKKHHTGHKKSSKRRADNGETSQERASAARCTERVTSTDSIEVVAYNERNGPQLIGAEIDISVPDIGSPQEEPMNLTQRKSKDVQHLDSPDELHRKCEVSSSADVLESILGRKLAQFDPLSVAGEIVAYPLYGQQRGQGGDGEGSDRDRNEKKRALPSVKETIANITDTVERELSKRQDKKSKSDTKQQGADDHESSRSTDPAHEDDEILSQRTRPPISIEWLATQNGASTSSSSSVQVEKERKRPSADPVMSSVAFKSPRLSDNETMEIAQATSSADESVQIMDEHGVPQLDIAQVIPEITQSHIDMESEMTNERKEQSDELISPLKLTKQTTEGFGLLPPSCDTRNRSPSKDPVLFPVPTSSHSDSGSRSAVETPGETTAQTISTIVQAVEKELSSRRSSQSEDSYTDGPMEDPLEQKSREIASVGGDKPKTPPPLAVDNMFSLGSDDSDSNDNEGRDTQSPADPNLYEFVGQMRRSPSRSASMILLASMNAQKVFNAPSTSTEGQSSDSPEKDFVSVPETDEEKLAIEVALKSNRCSLADISDIVGDLSKTSSSSSLGLPEAGRQRLDRIMSLTKMDLFEPESGATGNTSDSGVDTGPQDLSQSASPTVGPSSLTDMIQRDIQTNNGSGDDLTSLEKQMREKIAARLEQKDNLPPTDTDDQS